MEIDEPQNTSAEGYDASSCSGQDSDEPKVIGSQALLGGSRQLFIDHEGERYILRLTSKGKLILTK